jgi:uncharacterized protein (TIGR02611 family)
MKSAAQRIGLEILGWLLVVGGIAAIPLPGPGFLILFGGLWLLSKQYEWAEKRLAPVKKKAWGAAAEGVETWPRIVLSVLAAMTLFACGILWSWNPPPPGWWPLGDFWWLPGGLGTGITQMVSAVIALGLIAYSFRRFRVRGEPVPGESG